MPIAYTIALYHFIVVLLFSDEAEEPGIPHAFFCPAVKKSPVVFSRRGVVRIVFHQVSSM
jgi:hypothetical protein